MVAELENKRHLFDLACINDILKQCGYILKKLSGFVLT